MRADVVEEMGESRKIVFVAEQRPAHGTAFSQGHVQIWKSA